MRMRMRSALALAVALAAATPVRAQTPYVLIVTGLGGTEAYTKQFDEWASELRDALVNRHGVAPGNVIWLGEKPELSPGTIRARSTRENVLGALSTLADSMAADGDLMLVLIGHGTAQNGEARFNLPGPDLTPEDLNRALAAFGTRRIAIVHTGSASGGFVAPLAAPGRVVIAATKTARERNATRFPGYFVQAVAGNGADLDKDGRLSLLEAYLWARQEVARSYEKDNQLLTEHAVLDDDGNGDGTGDASVEGPDGKLAATFLVGATASTLSRAATTDSVLARLYSERDAIQARVERLRAAKDTIPQKEYEDRLEALLVELALKSREIRAREGGAP